MVIFFFNIGLAKLLTYRDRVTHICVSEIIIIGSDNGLSLGRRQAIIWTNAGILLIGPLGIKFNGILIEINTFSFKKMHLKMSSAKWRLFRLGLNVLIGHWCSRIELQQTNFPSSLNYDGKPSWKRSQVALPDHVSNYDVRLLWIITSYAHGCIFLVCPIWWAISPCFPDTPIKAPPCHRWRWCKHLWVVPRHTWGHAAGRDLIPYCTCALGQVATN